MYSVFILLMHVHGLFKCKICECYCKRKKMLVFFIFLENSLQMDITENCYWSTSCHIETTFHNEIMMQSCAVIYCIIFFLFSFFWLNILFYSQNKSYYKKKKTYCECCFFDFKGWFDILFKTVSLNGSNNNKIIRCRLISDIWKSH